MHDSDHRLQDEAAATHRKLTIKGDLLLSASFICSGNICINHSFRCSFSKIGFTHGN
ncbi:hypothetical protein OIU77_018110 [Salix suchowensis]|uniref:Uncharacterized protein n=1 Tax=Salix suchowensis TaxID=1278906 RepID=A0ABQ8ZR42_9ROSI|nr:hypothetical protein OIU77_018110 [Salix suchowensis]